MLWTQVAHIALLVATVHARACYTPAGANRNEQFGEDDMALYVPCNNSEGAHSMCCAFGPSRTASPDACRSDGFCSQGNAIWRESCTDPTWQDPACIKLFLNDTGYQGTTQINDTINMPLSDVLVTSCDNGSWCYGNGNQACCDQNQGLFVNAEGQQTNVNPNTTRSGSPSTTSTATATSGTTTSTSIPSTSDDQNSGLSTGAKAGIGVGVALFVLIAFGILIFFLVKRHRGTRYSQPTNAYETNSPVVEKYNPADRPQTFHELGVSHHPYDQSNVPTHPRNHAIELA